MFRYSLAVVMLAAMVGCGEDGAVLPSAEQAAQPVAFNEAGLPTVTFSVPDMHCEMACVPVVEDTLVNLDTVAEVNVDLDARTATVAVKDGFDAVAAIAALKEAGKGEGAELVDTAAVGPTDTDATPADKATNG